MKTERDYRDYLNDMLEAAEKVALFIRGHDRGAVPG